MGKDVINQIAVFLCITLVTVGFLWAQNVPLGGNHGVVESSPNDELSSAVSACPVGTQDDVVCYDNNGAVGGTRTGTTDPDGMLIRPQQCAPSDGTCTAGNLTLFGGQDTTTIAIDGADPSVTCADDDDTVTVTVIDKTGTSTATVLTEGTEWTASASVADTCSSLATAVTAVSGVSATCTSPDVLITLDPTTGKVTLAESTAGCTTVGAGTAGTVMVFNRLQVGDADFGPDYNDGATVLFHWHSSSDYWEFNRNTNIHQLRIGGTSEFAFRSTGLGVTNGVCLGSGCSPVDGVFKSTDSGGVDPGAHTSDPCGTLETGTIFYNATSNYHCFCNGAGADLKMNDNFTACF